MPHLQVGKETHLWGTLSLLDSQQWGELCLPWSYGRPSEGSRAGFCIPSLLRSSLTPKTKPEHILLSICPASPGGCVVPGSLCSLPSQALGLIEVDKYFQNKKLELDEPCRSPALLPWQQQSGGRGAVLPCHSARPQLGYLQASADAVPTCWGSDTARINLRLSELGARLPG